MANRVERARTIMGALKNVDDGSGGVGLIDAAKAEKWVDSFIEQYAANLGLDAEAIAGLTDGQKAGLYLKVMRQFHVDVRRAARANAAAEAARLAALRAVDDDDASDLEEPE